MQTPGCLFREIRRHQANIRQITKTLGIIHAVAYDKFVRDAESYIISFNFHQPSRRLVEQRGYTQRTRVMLLEELSEEIERKPGIENVFYNNNVFTFNRLVYVFDEPDRAAGFLALAVAGDCNKIKCIVHSDVPRKVGEKNRRALQHAQQNDVLSRIILVNLAAQFGNALRNLFAAEKDLKGGRGLRAHH